MFLYKSNILKKIMQKHILFNIQSLKNIDLFIGYLAAIQGMSFVACGI